MNMLAALNTLFYKYTGQTDIIIGSGIAGRRHADLQGVVGMFVNTLAMRNYPDGEKPYENFLQEVIATSVKGFENQDVQFEELVEKLDPERDPSRNPLFDINMVVQNFREVDPGILLEQLRTVDENSPASEFKNPISRFDLTFFVQEQGDDVFINIEYYTGIFMPDTIGRLVSHFKNVVKTVIEDPGIQLKEIAIISEEEKHQVLYEFNDTARDYPRDKSIPVLFAEQVEQTPDRIALVGAEGEAKKRRSEEEKKEMHLTYKELNEQSNRLANYLYYGNCVQPDQPVGIMMDRCLEMIIAVLGILKAGGAYVPISPSYPEERIKEIINDAGIKIFLSQKRYIKTLNRLQWGCGANLETFLCLDSHDVYGEEEAEENQLMSRRLWEYVGETAVDEVTGGGWTSSYTGEPIPKEEMDEYGDNILKKLEPLLHPGMRVLEIGVASGISMYRIAPRVGFYYGTDLSGIIIEKNRRRILEEGHKNIKLLCAAAHEIHRLDERNFDLVIINSVIQCFHGHNYLRKVIRKVIGLMGSRGYLFIGDIMDQDLKGDLIAHLVQFKQAHGGTDYKTKVDCSEELFISRSFLEDLEWDYPEIYDMEFSGKIHTLENELTRFRYDALIKIDKNGKERRRIKPNRRHKTCHDLRILKNFGADKPGRWPDSHNLAYIIYTSGSTGRPKGVLVEHGSVVNLICNQDEYFNINQSDRILQFSSICFDASVEQIFIAFSSGAVLVLIDKSILLDVEKFDKFVFRHQVSHINAVPSFLNNIQLRNASQLKRVVAGGDVCPVSLAEKWRADFDFYNGYGPTETTVTSIEILIKETNALLFRLPIGKPIANTLVYLLDRLMKPVPLGVIGELYIGGAGVTRGYLNRLELTAEKFDLWDYQDYHDENQKLLRGVQGGSFLEKSPPGRRRLYKTGDLARWLSDGNIEFIGRIDQQVKLRGYRIELGEIENRLLKYEAIKEAVVLLQEEESGDNYLCAYFVSNKEYGTSELRESLSQELPDYMIPSYFMQLEKIPLTPNGKMDRRALPKPELKGSESYTAPKDEIETKLVKIWSEVLGRDELHSSQLQTSIGMDDNFFQLGGHSLKATILVSKIHKVFDVKVPLVEIFKMPRIKELAKYIKGKSKEYHISIEPVEEKEYYELSPAQKRLYILQQLVTDNTSYNMPYVIPLDKSVEEKKLGSIFKRLIERHESLRTSFIKVNEEPVQRIHRGVDFSLGCYEVTERAEVGPLISGFTKPFNFGTAPLLRVNLIAVGSSRRVLFVDMHHIITDGTSQGILEKEFRALHEGEELPPLHLRCKDYSEWYNSVLRQEAIKQQESYWMKEFSDEIPVLNLPTDYPRPSRQSFEGNVVSFSFNEEETGIVKRIAAENNSTLYMFLLAVFNVLLSKLSGQEDIIIGTPIVARRHADLQDVIGMLVNTLAMRNYPYGDKPFRGFLKEVSQRSLDAYENQEYPFEVLVDKIMVNRDIGRNPVFDVMFNVLNQADYDGETSGQNGQDSYRHKKGTSKFDMNLAALEIGEKLVFTLEYSTALFKPERIERIIGYYKNIVKVLSRDSGLTISEIEIMDKEELEAVLGLSRGMEDNYEGIETLHRLFACQVEKTPDHIAVTGQSVGAVYLPSLVNANAAASPVIQLSYRELNESSNRLAYRLRKKGVGPDSVVGLMVERSLEMITGMLAIMKTGGAYLPIDPEYPGERKRYMLEDGEVRWLLVSDDIEDIGDEMINRLEVIDLRQEEIYARGNNNLEYMGSGSDLLYVIYTSGSTGKPRGVMLEQRNLFNLIHYQYKYTNIDFNRILQFTTISFDVSAQEIFSVFLWGGQLFLVNKETRADIPELFRLIERNGIKTVFLPISFLKMIFNEEEYINLIPRCIRHITTAGEQVVINNNFRKYLRERKVYLHNHYGPSETHVVTTLTLDPGGDIAELPSIGKPVMNTGIYIVDKWGNLSSAGAAGEILIGGVQVGRGYLNNPELTGQKFQIPNSKFQTKRSSSGVILNALGEKELYELHEKNNQKFLRGGPGGAVFSKSAPPGRRRHPTAWGPYKRIYKTGDLARWMMDGNIEFLGRISY
jgi:fengycin family lipopeptide synthetase D